MGDELESLPAVPASYIRTYTLNSSLTKLFCSHRRHLDVNSGFPIQVEAKPSNLNINVLILGGEPKGYVS